ncbi:MAG: hypothetical protein M5U01_38310 [Ardenticatenaceae bacterium]|nr:hypothetical protein [Ardenticatenaceae bacterium]
MSLKQEVTRRVDDVAGGFSKVDLTAERRGAIVALFQDQFGIEVTTIKVLTIGQSHASTPLMVEGRDRAGNPQRFFAKYIYAKNWWDQAMYRLFRNVVQPGKTEDEPIMPTVKKMVEFEHYMSLLFAKRGLRVPNERGVFHVRDEEFLFVSDFLEGCQPLIRLDSLEEDAVRDALTQLKTARHYQLAHRDIKASNLLATSDHQIWFVDLGYAEGMASEKLMDIDLANMLVVLTMRHNTRRVFEIAGEIFGADSLRRSLEVMTEDLLNRETAKSVSDGFLSELNDALARFLGAESSIGDSSADEPAYPDASNRDDEFG